MVSRIAACLMVVMVMLPGCREERATTAGGAPAAATQPAATRRAGPSPMLAPEQVVRIVTEAMGQNDTPEEDAGIATAFAFASPENTRVTGPLSRFVPMVKSPLYRPLLDYAKIAYGPIRVAGDYAEQVVTVTDAQGRSASFLFVLARQPEGEFEDCWMTDGVTRLGAEPPPPAPIDRREPEAGSLTWRFPGNCSSAS